MRSTEGHFRSVQAGEGKTTHLRKAQDQGVGLNMRKLQIQTVFSLHKIDPSLTH